MYTNTKFGQPRPNKYKEDIPDKFLWSDVNIQVSDLLKVHNTQHSHSHFDLGVHVPLGFSIWGYRSLFEGGN